MIRKRIYVTLMFAVILLVSTAVARAQSDEPEQTTMQTGANSQGWIFDVFGKLKEAQAQRFEGSWEVTVTPVVPPGAPQPPSFHAYGTASRGGGFFGSDRNRPSSKQHGVWEHLRRDDFAYTFKEDLFDAVGSFAGTLTVRVKLSLKGKNTFVGVSNGEQRDAAGNLVFNRCSTVRGERIVIEPLSQQCDDVSPPQ